MATRAVPAEDGSKAAGGATEPVKPVLDVDTSISRISTRPRSSARPRTPPLSPSARSWSGTDRLSALSTTMTDLSDFSPSPTASVASVRIATLTRVPPRSHGRHRSLGMESILSDLSNSDIVHDDALAEKDRALEDKDIGDDDATLLAGKDIAREEIASQSAVLLPSAEGLPSPQRRKAMRRSLDADCLVGQSFGPKTRVVSPPPWLSSGDENDAAATAPVSQRRGLATSRSLDLLSRSAMHGRGETSPRTADLDFPDVSGRPLSGHKRSASTNPTRPRTTSLDLLRKTPAPGSGFSNYSIADPATSIWPVGMTTSVSLSSLKGSLSAPTSSAIPDVGAAGLQAYAEARRAGHASRAAGGVDVAEYLESGPRATRAAQPHQTGSATPDEQTSASTATATAAPAGTLLFARRGVAHSESKISLAFSSTTSSSATASPSTPAGLGIFDRSPALTSEESSYFTAVPGAPAAGAFGHRLISLEEARARESERSAAARRKAASTPPLNASVDPREPSGGWPGSRGTATSETLSARRGMTAPSSLRTTPSNASLNAGHVTVKPKRSGFLRRMMGGGSSSEKHRGPVTSPDASRPSISPSVSTLCLSPTLSLAPNRNIESSTSTSSPRAEPIAESAQARISSRGTPERQESLMTPAGTSVSPSLSLRPVSAVFSAGLPAGFLADLPMATALPTSPTLSVHGPTSSTLSHSPTLSLSPPIGACLGGDATPLRSKASTSSLSPHAWATSAADGCLLPVSGTTTPLSASASGSFPGSVPLERYLALQDEFNRARSMWLARQVELEAQVKTLQARLAERDD